MNTEIKRLLLLGAPLIIVALFVRPAYSNELPKNPITTLIQNTATHILP